MYVARLIGPGGYVVVTPTFGTWRSRFRVTGYVVTQIMLAQPDDKLEDSEWIERTVNSLSEISELFATSTFEWMPADQAKDFVRDAGFV